MNKKGNSQKKRAGERGQGLAEYALIIAFVAIIVIAAVGLLGQSLLTSLNNTANQL